MAQRLSQKALPTKGSRGGRGSESERPEEQGGGGRERRDWTKSLERASSGEYSWNVEKLDQIRSGSGIICL